MTLAHHLSTIGWTPAEFGRRCGLDERNARRMVQDQRPVPDDIALWVAYVAALVEGAPFVRTGRHDREPRVGAVIPGRARASECPT